jgi:hypothetical protein
VERIKELDNYETYKSQAEECKALISSHLQAQATKIGDWIYENITKKSIYRDRLEKMGNGNLYYTLRQLPSNTLDSYENFANIDEFRLCLLDVLYGAIMAPGLEEEKAFKSFIFNCQSCIRRHEDIV